MRGGWLHARINPLVAATRPWVTRLWSASEMMSRSVRDTTLEDGLDVPDLLGIFSDGAVA